MRARVILYNREINSILLIERKKDGENYWVVPGGGVKIGENYSEAAMREINEELGVRITAQQLRSLFLVEEESEHQLFFYCEVNSSVTPTIKGEEASRSNINNQYIPCWVKIDCLNAIKLEPQVIRKKLISYFCV